MTTTHNNGSRNNYSSGIGFLGALTILFIALKLTGSINWSWIWVLAPIWLPFTSVYVLFLIGVAVLSFVKN